MHDNIKINITIEIDPNLTKFVKETEVPHEDITTNEDIPVGSTCYSVGVRFDKRRKLYRGYITPASFDRLGLPTETGAGRILQTPHRL